MFFSVTVWGLDNAEPDRTELRRDLGTGSEVRVARTRLLLLLLCESNVDQRTCGESNKGKRV